MFAYAALKSLTLGPLGLAIVLALGAYAMVKWAGQTESNALERWARRCYFGKGGEKTAVHWDVPEYADIAYAELNAAALGVQVKANFESIISSGPESSKIGGLVHMEFEHKLKFQIVLPGYNDERSAYRWSLVVHRHGDGNFPDFIGGETLLVDEYRALPVEALTKATKFQDFAKPRFPDYRSDFTVNRRRLSTDEGEMAVSWLEIAGAIELSASIGPHSIGAVTLLVMYWPDSKLPSAYVEACIKEINE